MKEEAIKLGHLTAEEFDEKVVPKDMLAPKKYMSVMPHDPPEQC